MEQVVLENLDSVLAQYPDCCKCDLCRRDIAILALNHLPPRYTSSEKGRVYEKVNAMSQHNVIEVVEEIAKAVEIVRKNPRHEAS
ncbi:MAG: late competence development ComFB family protein [Schwartzia sp.]|nr:late competence development ComFB family protein [Schwartzia sp. (in: firmicutes)]MBR1885686.1 late competence development ComFB family protein [Schwartzia sp. (in: firmicutes)]